jgi:hypothetical protein
VGALNCKDVKELLSEYMDNELTPEQAAEVQAHLDGCDACKEQLEELVRLHNSLKEALKTAAGDVVPPVNSLAIIKERAGMKSSSVKNGFWSRMSAPAGVALSLFLALITLLSSMSFLSEDHLFSIGGYPPSKPPLLVSDGEGGVMLYWRTGDYEYEQYIDAEGNLLWGENGRDITGGTPSFDLPEPVSESGYTPDLQVIYGDDGSCIKVYLQGIGGVLYAWKTDSSGNILWGSDAVAYPLPDIEIPDDVTGVYTFYYEPTGYPCISVYPDPDFNTMGYSSVISDGAGGVIIFSRVGMGVGISNTHLVYAQHIDSEGNLLWGESGMVIQSVPSAPTALIIAVVSLIIAVMVIIGLIRGNKAAQISTPVISLGLFFVAMYCVNLMYGTFGNNVYEWSYVLNTPLNWVAIWGIIICGLVLAVLGIKKAKLNKWIMIPVFVPYVLWAGITILWICLSNF